MHCWNSNQGPLTYEKVGKKKLEKKEEEKTLLPGFKLASCWLREQCSDHYTTETSQLNIFKKCPL